MPDVDQLCRFFPGHLADDDGQPTADAFRARKRKLSVYHVAGVTASGKLADLCFATLANHGEAELTAGEFKEIAKHVMELPVRPKGVPDDLTGRKYRPPNFDVPSVTWCADETGADWAKWRDFHVNVETPTGNQEYPLGYRAALAEECRVLRGAESPK